LRARELCEKLNKQAELAQVLGGLSIFYYVHAEYHRAMELAFEALDLAQSINDEYLVLMCHWYLGFINFCFGEFPISLKYLRQVAEFYDPRRHHQILVQMRGSDPGVGAMAYEACCLWCLGYPDQALEKKREALALSHEFSHPFTHADVLCYAGCQLSSMRRDSKDLGLESKELIQLSQQASLAGWMATGERYLGETLVLQGKLEESIVQIDKGVEALRTEGVGLHLSGTFATLAEGQFRANLVEDARATLDEAFKFVEEVDERYWESELFRLKGELLSKDGDFPGAEACLKKAIDIAQKQKAKSLELRAAMSLSRLWGEQGKKYQARKILTEIYEWFTEGFDTPDLLEAKALLDELK
jgi:adenylate cyclase